MSQPLSFRRIGIAGMLVALLLGPTPGRRASAGVPPVEEGVALAIVFDTSGSMRDPVPDRNGQPTPKFIVATRAFHAIVDHLQSYRGPGADASKRLEVALLVFQKNQPHVVLSLRPFDAQALRAAEDHFKSPANGTPLGTSVATAEAIVRRSHLSRQHVLVVTDGLNTVGPSPEQVISQLQQTHKGPAKVAYHFVAFDTDARLFGPLKVLGATVVGATDEKQLNSQLEFILQRKILLEDEEPPAKPSGKPQ